MLTLKKSNVSVHFTTPVEKRVVKKSFKVVTSSVQRFFNCQHLLYKLTKDERAFYDYLCECMNDSNMITINANLKNNFIEHFWMLTSKKKRFNPRSFTNYVSKLLELGLLIKMGNNHSAFYCINPRYIFKGSKSRRLELIAELVNQRGSHGLSLKGLIDRPEEEFLGRSSITG